MESDKGEEDLHELVRKLVSGGEQVSYGMEDVRHNAKNQVWMA